MSKIRKSMLLGRRCRKYSGTASHRGPGRKHCDMGIRMHPGSIGSTFKTKDAVPTLTGLMRLLEKLETALK